MSSERGAARSRQLARELLVKALYQWQLAGHPPGELVAQFSTLSDYERCDQEYFAELLVCVTDNAKALDQLIARQAVRAVEQIDAVGRGILLLGLAELSYREDIPTKVIINEAVELAKRYGAAESFKFVNAVLDKTARELDRPAPARGKKR